MSDHFANHIVGFPTRQLISNLHLILGVYKFIIKKTAYVCSILFGLICSEHFLLELFQANDVSDKTICSTCIIMQPQDIASQN